MTEGESESSYGAVGSTTPVREGEEHERVRSISSFYDDQTKDCRTVSDVGAEKARLHEGEQEEKPGDELFLSFDNSPNEFVNGITTEKMARPTYMSLNNNEQSKSDASSSISPGSSQPRRVSFLAKPNHNEATDPDVAYDNRGYSSDMMSSTDSIRRVRAITNCSVRYHTHSEGEECNESDISQLTLNFQQNSQSTPRARRRRYTRHGTLVSDSFVNECICCCTII